VRDAAAKILESTSLADILKEYGPSKNKKHPKKNDATVLPMAVSGKAGA
jgi:hypothetical protein